MKSISKIVESINNSNIIIDDMIKVDMIKFEREFMLSVTTNKSSVILNGINTEYLCTLAKTILNTLKNLSKEHDSPIGVFNTALIIDEEFANMILKEVGLNILINK